jgi:hypothetical protein
MGSQKFTSEAQSFSFRFRVRGGRGYEGRHVFCHLPDTPIRNALGDACGYRWHRLLTLLTKLHRADSGAW